MNVIININQFKIETTSTPRMWYFQDGVQDGSDHFVGHLGKIPVVGVILDAILNWFIWIISYSYCLKWFNNPKIWYCFNKITIIVQFVLLYGYKFWRPSWKKTAFRGSGPSCTPCWIDLRLYHILDFLKWFNNLKYWYCFKKIAIIV